MQKALFLLSLMVVSLSACRLGSDPGERGASGAGQADQSGFPVYQLTLEEQPANLGQLPLQLGQLAPFHGRFVLEFNGKQDWTYQVDMRADGTQIEYLLVIEGVGNELDPGDVRLVNSRT